MDVNGFLLSPGITPLLTDWSLVAFVLLPGLGAAWGGRRGFLVGFLLVGVGLAAVKLVTDWFDPFDDVIAVGALAGALGWAARDLRVSLRAERHAYLAVGLFALLTGLLKVYSDFYDPFDLLVALTGVVGGLALLGPRPRRPRPLQPVVPG